MNKIGVRIEVVMLVYNSSDMTAIEPYLILDKDEVKRYLTEQGSRNNPFPETEHYSKQDLIDDSESTGSWTLPLETTEEQKKFIIDMLDYFY